MTSNNDEKVLNAILNPNTPFEEETEAKNTESKYELDTSIDEAKKLEIKVQSVDELAEEHRKKKKELTAKIQAMKKSVTKGDKKKKKEIDAQISRLEEEFAEKCKLEIEQLKMAANKSLKSQQDEPINQTESKQPTQKISKAQKRRDKKEKDNEERNKLIAMQEIENLKGPSHIELTRIKEKLLKKNLEIKEVSSDGNCMYYAVSDQLKQCLDIEQSFENLRILTCDYMLKNPDEFQPYMCSEETGDPMSQEEYREYCIKTKECVAPVWGSMTELKALSEALKVVIEVVQAEGSEILIGNSEQYRGRLVIAYHRCLFGAGEHYNSTCSIKNDNF